MSGHLIGAFTCPILRAIKKRKYPSLRLESGSHCCCFPRLLFSGSHFFDLCLFLSLSLPKIYFLFCEVIDDQLFDASVDSSIATMTTRTTTTTMIEKRNGNRSGKTMMMIIIMMMTMLAQSSCAYCNEADACRGRA